MEIWQQTPAQALTSLHSSPAGLSLSEVRTRLKRHGLNELKIRQHWTVLKKIIAPFTNAFIIILLIGGGVSWLIGHRRDTAVILVVVVVSALIEWGQQLSAAKILASLKKYNAKTVKVRRDGAVSEIDASQLVPGDIVLLGGGEKVPADGRLINTAELMVDESALTGESLPITKKPEPLVNNPAVYQRANMVFMGTLVLTGRAEVLVTATGNSTEFGKIAKLATAPAEPPPIVLKIKKMAWQLTAGALLIAGLVAGLGYLRQQPALEMLRLIVALIVSIIPEGLPVTLTVILLLGVQRMAKQKALVRNLQAVETLGMITTIATDKTGTLTYNRMQISQIWDLDGSLSGADHTDLWLSVSHTHPDLNHPIEKLITKATEEKGRPSLSWQEVDDLPFDASRRFTSVLWHNQATKQYRVYIKGAPEVVLASCRLSKTNAGRINSKLADMSGGNMRVIAVAKKIFRNEPSLADTTWQLFDFEGLIGFRDEPRTEAAGAIAATKRAGIKVLLLTGDHQITARTVAADVGIAKASEPVVMGTDLVRLSKAKLTQLLLTTRVFARVLPEHKFRLLEILKHREITAMTGDGVNDAPALAKADVGIAMGSGTDAAKEAADVVLLDDNYATIVNAIKEGRRVYANVRKMIFHQLSANFAEALTVVGGLALGLPLTMTAAQILWLNLVTESTLIVPLGLEPPESRQMQTPPRTATESLLSNHLFGRLMWLALTMALISLWIFMRYLPSGLGTAQTMVFLSLCFVQIAHAFNSRSETRYSWQGGDKTNYKLWIGVIISLVLITLSIYSPLGEYVGTVPIPPQQLLWLFIPIGATLLAADLHKLWSKR